MVLSPVCGIADDSQLMDDPADGHATPVRGGACRPEQMNAAPLPAEAHLLRRVGIQPRDTYNQPRRLDSGSPPIQSPDLLVPSFWHRN